MSVIERLWAMTLNVLVLVMGAVFFCLLMSGLV